MSNAHPKKRGNFSAAAFDAEVQQVVESLRRGKNVIHRDAASRELQAIPARENLPPVVLVPGAFFREYPQHGGYGQAIEDALLRLGIPVTRIEVPSFCSVHASGERISDWFAKYQGEPVILVSLSKGSADVVQFFSLLKEKNIPLTRVCHSWISICGLVNGTAIVEAIKRERLRFFIIRLLFRRLGYQIADLDSLNPSECSARAKEVFTSLAVNSFHVVAVPYSPHLSSKFATRAAKRAWKSGASDGGGVLLADYLSLPGTVIALHGTDHYFKTVSVESVLSLVFSQITNLPSTLS